MKIKQKGFIGIAIIILVALAVVSGGAYLYTTQKEKVSLSPNSTVSVDSTNCKNGAGRIKDLCDEEFIYSAVKNKDPNLCIEGAAKHYPIDAQLESGVKAEREKIKEESIERCYTKIAATYNDVSYCGLISPESYIKPQCYGEIASQTNNINICDNSSYFATQYGKDSCYWGVSGHSKVSSVCNNISDSSLQSLCYLQARNSTELSDISYCEKIKTDLEQNACRYDVAVHLSDKKLCQKITGLIGMKDIETIEDTQKLCEKDIDTKKD